MIPLLRGFTVYPWSMYMELTFELIVDMEFFAEPAWMKFVF